MKTYLNTKIHHLLYTGITATLLVGCGGGVSSYNENTYTSIDGELIELGTENPVCQQGSATQKGRVVDLNNQRGIAGAEVEIAGCVTQTDENGYYQFTNIPVAKRVAVNIEKENYLDNSEIITIDEDTKNYLEVSLDSKTIKWSYESNKGSSERNLDISSDVRYQKEDGTNYIGKIELQYQVKNTTTDKEKESFPGTFEGLNSNGVIVPFVNYKYMVLKLRDDEGNNIDIQDPITVNIYNLTDTDASEIPLWYYHENKGIWIEQGTAHRDDNDVYKCEITHTGVWSINKPVEKPRGKYKSQILDENLNPMPNVRVKATGKNWQSKDLTTDENGEFELYVVPDEEFTLSAYNYEEEFGAEYTDTLKGVPSDSLIED